MIAVAERLTDQMLAMTAELRLVDPDSLTVADRHALSVLLVELTALLRLAETA